MHLVGCLHRCTNDARSHKHQIDERGVFFSFLIIQITDTKHTQFKPTLPHIHILHEILTWPRVLVSDKPCRSSWPPGSNTSSPHELYSYYRPRNGYLDMWFVINETGLVTNITMVWPAAVPCRTASVNTGFVMTSQRRVRVTLNCITGRQRLDVHHFGGNAGPRIAPRVTRDISRNYTTTVPSIATVQYTCSKYDNDQIRRNVVTAANVFALAKTYRNKSTTDDYIDS